jgi:hypothetical protein
MRGPRGLERGGAGTRGGAAQCTEAGRALQWRRGVGVLFGWQQGSGLRYAPPREIDKKRPERWLIHLPGGLWLAGALGG